jgi:hypothetical protein
MHTRTVFVGLAIVVGLIALPVAWWLISPLFTNKTVAEALPTAAPTRTPAAAQVVTPAPAQATEAMETATVEPTQVVAEPMPTAAPETMTVVAHGQVYPIAHEGRGTATIYRLATGERLLRFENFEVLNGPDLHVWLVPVDPVPNSFGVEIAGYFDLGELKGNIGDQNYALPADLDLSRFKSVVIWCQPFRVPFAAAPLAAP